MITELEFKSLALAGYNRIPLIAEAFADLETPLSLYLKLAHAKGDGRLSFLLESVVGGERFGRYSFIGLPARTFLRATGFGADARTEVVRDGQVIEHEVFDYPSAGVAMSGGDAMWPTPAALERGAVCVTGSCAKNRCAGCSSPVCARTVYQLTTAPGSPTLDT